MNSVTRGVIDTIKDGIAILTLNAPTRKNALSSEVRFALLAAMEKYVADPVCRVIVLTGAAQTFCAGGDVSEMKPPLGTTPREYAFPRMKALHNSIRHIAAGPKPVVAAVEGHAAGAGMSLAAACDYVVASDAACFVASFSRMGLVADCGLLWTLPNRVGHNKALDLLLTARPLTAYEALQNGLVDEVVPEGETLTRALEKAASYIAVAPLSIAFTKRIMAGAFQGLEDILNNEFEWQAELKASVDHKEARDAFLQKRTPNFQGY